EENTRDDSEVSSLTITFPQRRNPRRFPILSALVSSLISPERRDVGEKQKKSQKVINKEKKRYSRRPLAEGRSPQSFESIVTEVINDEENETDRPITEDMRVGSSSRASCLACNAVAALFLSPFYSKEAMVTAARSVCISFRLQSARVCRGLVHSFKDDLDYIRRHTKLTRREMCGVLFGLDCARAVTKNLNWSIPIPPRKSANSIRRSGYSFDLAETRPLRYSYSDEVDDYNMSSNFLASASHLESQREINVVQITDIHVDPFYMPGTNAQCGEPLCCRLADGFTQNPSKAAGVWGDYRSCDTPIGTLRHALRHISENHPYADYWMWTGDIAPHDIWNVTRSEVLSQIALVTSLMKQYVKVPVLPVIGNHEGVPVNSFPPPEVKGPTSISWLYEAVAKEWSFWLPQEAIRTLRYGGYYTVRLRPGFRVICLNTNYCTRLNPWTLYDPVDPGHQLSWLAKELLDAEYSDDKVHIIGHIPPDNKECTQAWLFNFLRIIDRFQHTVLAQYYGHTHRDEFRILYSPHNLRKPISVAYIGPSITPFIENNPAFRLYRTDVKGYVKDHETYFFNLTEANEGQAGPKWIYEYKASKTFDIDDFGPDGWHRFVGRLIEDDALFQHFHKLYYRWSEVKRFDFCHKQCKQIIVDDLIVDHPLKTKPRRLFGLRRH
ncbi:sphingomyelin phosphodiesterase-like protein 2, partial [Dinothrombium tinctorium]